MSPRQRPPIIAVIGGGSPPAEALRDAYQVGFELAERGAVVVCGGLTGVMEAVCRGAKDGGGTTVGILPGGSADASNLYVDIPIPTGMGYARNALVVKAGQAVIAIDGSFGTLSEIGHALGDGIPLVGLGTWTFSVNGQQDDSILRATTPVEAVEMALTATRVRTGEGATAPEAPR